MGFGALFFVEGGGGGFGGGGFAVLDGLAGAPVGLGATFPRVLLALGGCFEGAPPEDIGLSSSSILSPALKTRVSRTYEGLGSAGGESAGLSTVCGGFDDIEGWALDEVAEFDIA